MLSGPVTPIPRRPLKALAFAAAASLLPALASADAIWTKTGGQTAIEGTILKIEGGKLVMQSSRSGNQMERPAADVVKVRADGEIALNEAEEAFEKEKWDAAAASYNKAIAATRKDWVKDRSLGRLVAAAERAGQFPLQAAAYAQLASRDPTAAADKKPVIPADRAAVAAALPLVERVWNAKPTDALVRSFLADLYVATEQYDAIAKLHPPGTPKDAGVVSLQAAVALKRGNAAVAVQTIEQNKALFVQPDQQLTALWTLAEGKAALAAADPAKMQDAAIAYLRLPAHFNAKPDVRVVEAVSRAAGLLEKLGQLPEAAGLYKQVADDDRSKGTPLAAEARRKYEQLKNARPPAPAAPAVAPPPVAK